MRFFVIYHGWKIALEIFAADKNQMWLMGIHAILITPRHISSACIMLFMWQKVLGELKPGVYHKRGLQRPRVFKQQLSFEQSN